MNQPGNLFGPFSELAAFVPCTLVFLAAYRLPVVQFRNIRIHLAGPIVCAVTLWIGAATGALGTVAAALIDARLFLHYRSARIDALRSAIPFAAASVAAGIVLAASPQVSASTHDTASLSSLAFLRFSPAMVAFIVTCGVGFAALDRLSATGQPTWATCRRLRPGVTLLGFVPLAAVLPLSVSFGAWALLPLLAFLAIEGLFIRRAFELSNLRKQLAVSQAMGLAGLADAATAEPTALLYRFLHLAQTLVHSERGLVWLVDDVQDEIVPAIGLPDMGEFAGIRTRLGEGLIGTAAERTRPLIVSDAARTLRRSENEPAADSWLLYPIISQQKLLGVAHWTRSASIPFSPDDAAMLEALVPHVGLAVENLRARNQMRELAATDGLTGLYNHRRVRELLREEMRRAERYNRPLSVLMVDVDGFKSFNDAYGHPSGDELLRTVAHLLRSGVRTVDRIGRYGGEEFIIVMPETHKDDAFLLAERLRSAMEQRAFMLVAGEEIHRTVSVGVASYPEDGLNPQEVISRADEALYRAKNSGRNRVVWA